MIAFTEKDTEQMKKKVAANPGFLERIERATADVRRKLYIQETAKATWGHYYLCPKHTVRLEFDYDDPIHYRCPIDGEIFTGEPYEGAWWCEVVTMNCRASYQLAVAYLLTGKEEYLEMVHRILLGYAKRYPSYEIHGGIPYNNPGKMAAQVLNDSDYLNSLARAYDLVKETFTAEEQELIERDLLLEGANHLMTYFTPQIHNHEVCINSALGIIGLVLNRPDLIERAVDGKYGLKYQLDHAVLEDGFWFEGSGGYHHYALRWFLFYEKVARYTKYRMMEDPHYRELLRKMMVYCTKILQPDLTTPKLNDGSSEGFRGKEYIYEFGYQCFPEDEEMLWCLHRTVDGTEREDLESLLYGVENLPPMPEFTQKNYLAPNGTCFGILYGTDHRYLLFKGLPYGGEHDHYDRLGISFHAFGKKMCADLGTAGGYGAPLHYAYFKNTATHNTVAINGENMPPANSKIHCYRENGPEDVYLDALVDWRKEQKLPDSFIIKQWSEESYKDVFMRRRIRWFGDFFIDIFTVEAPNSLPKEWILHVDGERISPLPGEQEVLGSISEKKPQCYLHDVVACRPDGMTETVYDCGDEVLLHVHTMAEGKQLLYGLGPDNPSVKDISYLMERSNETSITYVNVLEACKAGQEKIASVEVTGEGEDLCVTVSLKDGTRKTHVLAGEGNETV